MGSIDGLTERGHVSKEFVGLILLQLHQVLGVWPWIQLYALNYQLGGLFRAFNHGRN